MFNYTNLKCEVCGEEFLKDSDIVVCPDCGTPHHRHCYKDLGHCIHHTEHSKGFEWVNANDASPQIKIEKVCPKCNFKNDINDEFCSSCKSSLDPSNNDISSNLNNINPETAANNNIPTVSTPFPKSPLDFIQQLNNDLSSEIDGVLVKDIAVYLGANSYEYIRKFKRMESEKTYRPFMLAAFLFGWPYFFYRKMWDMGLISFIISICSSHLLSQGLTNPELISNDPFLSFVLFGTLAFSIIQGFIAYPLMKKKVIRELKAYKATSPTQDEYYKIISQKAGPSKLVIALGFAYWLMLIFGSL